jgi:predicted double-glycine peptidase
MHKYDFRFKEVVFHSALPRSVFIDMHARASLASRPSMLTSVPEALQSTEYSCGAASLQAVLSYYGTDVPEQLLMDCLSTSPRNGTDPDEIVRVARELGFDATMDIELTISDLAASVREGVPVIIAAQAWTEERSADFSWADDWEDGHYMVVVGVDGDFVYLEDPAMTSDIGALPIREFNDRWHNYLGDSHDAHDAVNVQHMGIFITRD